MRSCANETWRRVGPLGWLGRSVLLGGVAMAACGRQPAAEGPAAGSPAVSPAGSEIFAEVTEEVGLDFVHFNGMTGGWLYVEHLGVGGALFDYDQDGDLDLYIPQGHLLGAGKQIADAVYPPRHPLPLTDRLYRNDLSLRPDGSREVRLVDVTERSRIEAPGYGMGTAVGDYDNDGWPDLYVTNWGTPNQLFRNRGDGTFAEATDRARVGERRWTCSAAFFDYDRDGWLDLFAVNYLDWTFSIDKECTDEVGNRDYCGPLAYLPIPDTLYHNRGDGSFEDVTMRAGIGTEAGSGLGIVASDFDGNGWLDVYITNDGLANHLWLNQGDGTFVNEALLAGAALNSEGQAEAGMGVAAGDVDGDGDEDIFCAHLSDETNTLYTNDLSGIFTDRTLESGLGGPSYRVTTFGANFLDYDNDGRLEVLTTTGAVHGLMDQRLASEAYPMRQKNQLFHQRADGKFEDVSDRAGRVFELEEVSRGSAFGDIDNDGDTDAVIFNNADPARMLFNLVGQDSSWLGIRALGAGGRDMLGTWIVVERPGRPSLGRRVRTEGSYASAHDARALFGLGEEGGAVTVRVEWPDGRVSRWRDLPVGGFRTLFHGSG